MDTIDKNMRKRIEETIYKGRLNMPKIFWKL